MSPFADGTTIVTERLALVPLRVEDAEEMAGVLCDERLHEFIGGEPDTITSLRERFARLVAGSPDPDDVWLNWIIRRRWDAQAMGTVQATLTMSDGGSTANAAWVIGVDWQNQGSRQRRPELSSAGCGSTVPTTLSPTINPDHQASAAVATRAGLRPTDEQADGDQVWRAPDGGTGSRSLSRR